MKTAARGAARDVNAPWHKRRSQVFGGTRYPALRSRQAGLRRASLAILIVLIVQFALGNSSPCTTSA